MKGFVDGFIEYFVKPVFKVFYRLLFRAYWINLEAIPESGGIICANHISNHDGILIGCVIKKRLIHWATKEELFRNRVIAAILRRVGCVKVNRDQADIGSVRELFRILHKKELVGIFPEGTRMKNKNRDDIILSRSPVILSERTGLPVIPVSICGSYRLFGRTGVIVGEPVVYKREKGKKYSEEELKELMDKLMDGIYDEREARMKEKQEARNGKNECRSN